MVLYRCCRRTSFRFLTTVCVDQRWMIRQSFRTSNVSPYFSECLNSTSALTTQDRPFNILMPFRKQSTFANAKNDESSVWLKMCFSLGDVKNYEFGPIDPTRSYRNFTRSNGSLHDIKKKAFEMFDTIENLEYFDAEQHTWIPIEDLSTTESLLESHKSRILHLRIPEYFDSFVIGDMHDDPHDEFHDFDEREFSIRGFNFADDDDTDHPILNRRNGVRQPDNTAGHDYDSSSGSAELLMEQMIRGLQKQLRESGYVRSSVRGMTLHNIQNKDEISTKQWVLQECSNSTKLRSAILGKANAINHIVQCLHYDFLWNR